MAFRKGIAALFISENRILLGERVNPRGVWQLPQGGAEAGESLLQTLAREVEEEVGVRNLKVISQTPNYLSYTWPPGMFSKNGFTGQEHIYFLLNGDGLDAATLGPTEEFVHFKWASIEEAVTATVDWKRAALLEALRFFKLYSS